MSLANLPPGVIPGNVRSLWFVSGASYSLERVYLRAGRFYVHKLRTFGEIGVSLFFSQTEAMAAAQANLERVQAAGRVQVAPFESVAEALGMRS